MMLIHLKAIKCHYRECITQAVTSGINAQHQTGEQPCIRNTNCLILFMLRLHVIVTVAHDNQAVLFVAAV